jgi:hypothetical protein
MRAVRNIAGCCFSQATKPIDTIVEASNIASNVFYVFWTGFLCHGHTYFISCEIYILKIPWHIFSSNLYFLCTGSNAGTVEFSLPSKFYTYAMGYFATNLEHFSVVFMQHWSSWRRSLISGIHFNCRNPIGLLK